MASIIDSFREVFGDKAGFFKMLFFAVPIFFLHDMYVKNPVTFFVGNWLLWLTVFFLLGFMTKVTNNVLNERDTLMPSLNPFPIAVSALKGSIAVGPIAFVCIWIANYAISFIQFGEWPRTVLVSIIWLLAAGIALTAFLAFVHKEKISDAYNFKVISDKAPDLVMGIIFYAIQLVVVNIFTFVFLGYAISILFGFHNVFYSFASYALVFNIMVTGHYLAQLQYEILGLDKEKKDDSMGIF